MAEARAQVQRLGKKLFPIVVTYPTVRLLILSFTPFLPPPFFLSNSLPFPSSVLTPQFHPSPSIKIWPTAQY